MKPEFTDMYRATLDRFHQAVLWMDPQGNIPFANQAAVELLGISHDDIEQLTVFRIRPDLTQRKWSEWWIRAKEAGTTEEPTILLGAGGKEIHRNILSTHHTLSDQSEFLWWVFAPSEPHVGKTPAVGLQEEFRKKIIDFIGDSIFVKDRQGRLVMMNQATASALGKPMNELIGLSDYDLFSAQEADVFKKRDEEVFQTGREDVNEETITAPGLEPRSILTRKQLYVDANGTPFIVGIYKDITALKSAEAKLVKANETLEQKVRERTWELERANQEMTSRIEQLHYLNERGQNFAHLLEREDVLREVFHTFSARFPGCPMQMVECTDEGFASLRCSQAFSDSPDIGLSLLEIPPTQPKREIVLHQPQSALAENPGLSGSRLWIPFWSGRKLLGGIQIIIPPSVESALATELPLLGTLASQASAAWENANHYSALEEKTRMESELQVARQIQMHYIPEPPDIPGLSLTGVCQPAREIGGDYLDYFQNEKGDWVIAIADVCGKGIPAALVMTSLRSCIRAEGRKAESARDLLISVNRLMATELQREMSFITCLCLILSDQGRVLNLSRAGHPQLLAYGTNQDTATCISSRGIALGMASGIFFESKLENITLALRPGDKFFAYTDGVDEAMNSRNETYGKERLMRTLKEHRGLPAPELIQEVLTDVNLHVNGRNQFDDMTLLAIEKIF